MLLSLSLSFSARIIHAPPRRYSLFPSGEPIPAAGKYIHCQYLSVRSLAAGIFLLFLSVCVSEEGYDRGENEVMHVPGLVPCFGRLVLFFIYLIATISFDATFPDV